MTGDGKDKVAPHQTPLWSAVISGLIVIVGTSVWGWIQGALKGVSPGWIALVVGAVACAALIAFVRPARAWVKDASRFVWSLRPTTQRHLEARRGAWNQTMLDLLDVAKTQAEMRESALQRQLDSARRHSGQIAEDLREDFDEETQEAAERHRVQLEQAQATARTWEIWARRGQAEVQRLKDGLVTSLPPIGKKRVGRGLQFLLDELKGSDLDRDYAVNPQWSASRDDSDSGRWSLVQLSGGSVSRSVQIRSQDLNLEIRNGGPWDQVKSGSKHAATFETTQRGKIENAGLFEVTWVDEDGRFRMEEISAEPYAAVSPSTPYNGRVEY